MRTPGMNDDDMVGIHLRQLNSIVWFHANQFYKHKCTINFIPYIGNPLFANIWITNMDGCYIAWNCRRNVIQHSFTVVFRYCLRSNKISWNSSFDRHESYNKTKMESKGNVSWQKLYQLTLKLTVICWHIISTMHTAALSLCFVNIFDGNRDCAQWQWVKPQYGLWSAGKDIP